jgi:hypothetical protein
VAVSRVKADRRERERVERRQPLQRAARMLLLVARSAS